MRTRLCRSGLGYLRREAFVSRTNEPPAGLDIRMLINRIRGEFVDVR
jgi:hypothetical protein